MNPKTKTLLIGGGLGAVIGVLAGWLYFNSNAEVDEEGQELIGAPAAGDALKLGLSILGVLRLITG